MQNTSLQLLASDWLVNIHLIVLCVIFSSAHSSQGSILVCNFSIEEKRVCVFPEYSHLQAAVQCFQIHPSWGCGWGLFCFVFVAPRDLDWTKDHVLYKVWYQMQNKFSCTFKAVVFIKRVMYWEVKQEQNSLCELLKIGTETQSSWMFGAKILF